jgi:hypothetical protein
LLGITCEHWLGGIDKSNGGMGFSRFGWEAKYCIFRLSVLGGSGLNRKMYRIACVYSKNGEERGISNK